MFRCCWGRLGIRRIGGRKGGGRREREEAMYMRWRGVGKVELGGGE